MKIKIKIDNINYGELAVKCMPLIRDNLSVDDGPVPKLLSGLTVLPPGMVRSMLNALPDEKKDELAAYLINKNKEQIITDITRYMQGQGIDVEISDLTVEE